MVKLRLLSNRVSAGERDDSPPPFLLLAASGVNAASLPPRSARSAPLQGRALFDSNKPGRQDAAPHVRTALDAQLPASGLDIEFCSHNVPDLNHGSSVLRSGLKYSKATGAALSCFSLIALQAQRNLLHA